MNTNDLDPAMGEALRSRLNRELRGEKMIQKRRYTDKQLEDIGIATTVCPRTWHLTDTDLDRDAAFYLTKPYTT